MVCCLDLQQRSCTAKIDLVGLKNVADELKVPNDFFTRLGFWKDENMQRLHIKDRLSECLENNADYIFLNKKLPAEFFGEHVSSHVDIQIESLCESNYDKNKQSLLLDSISELVANETEAPFKRHGQLMFEDGFLVFAFGADPRAGIYELEIRNDRGQ